MNKINDFIATIFKRDHIHDGTRREALAIVEKANRDNQRAADRLTKALELRPDKMRDTIRDLLDANDRARRRGNGKLTGH